MKRFLSLVVLCFCVLLASPKYIGDVNGDGAITVADVTAMVNILVSSQSSTDGVEVNDNNRLADVDCI